ncbi:signal peptidase II [Helcococcus kunzii]|uniref:signal peptidase II n=1 Tax=Helcococcus kunzii TaxID=40091 RepID=UPI0024AD9850|nr:signal peptidase II [Helcococcus kunzii]
MEKIKKTIYLTLILVLIEQLAKIIVNIFFNNISFRLLNGRIGFDVYLNKDYMSIFNHDYNLKLSIGTLIFIGILTLLFLFTYYMYILKNNALNSQIRFCLILVIISGICSLIDKIFWGGSLDFIVFFGYIIDIKDIYLYVGVILGISLFIYEYVIMKRNLEQAEILSLKGYIKFLKNIFRMK